MSTASTARPTAIPGFVNAVRETLPRAIEIRRDLHRHPEIAYEEFRTCELIQRELASMGVEFQGGLAGGTGVIAHIPATIPGDRPAVALRADIDALPMTETTGLPYASVTPGRMHACGHDGHTAILLATARTLLATATRPNPVTLLFQPAEEGGGGAARLCEDGALEGASAGRLGPKVGRVFGLHGWPNLGLGQVATRSGPLLAATDEIRISIRGVGGHAAFPHTARDPIVASAAVVTALQTIASRRTSPLDSVVCTIGAINGGSARNVIPSQVDLLGTVRTLRAETRELAERWVFEIASGVAQAHGCEADIEWNPGYPATVNDARMTEHVFEVARGALGASRVSELPEPVMGGEDFSYYGAHAPACFFVIGLTPGFDGAGVAEAPQLHQTTFDFNDDAIETGVTMMCSLALAEV